MLMSSTNPRRPPSTAKRSVLLAAVAAAAIVAATSPCPSPAQTAVPVLRVATTPIDVGAQVLFAKDEGFLRKAGVDADISLINNGAAIVAAVASGAVDIGQANLVSLATAHERGLPFVLIAPAGSYTSSEPTTALIVARSSPARAAKDLGGKTIAVSGIKNITQVGASAWLDQNGGDPNGMHWIELPFPQMAPALEAGRVDAAVVAEPELSDAVANGARVLAPVYSAIGKEFLIGAWFARADWVKAHPDLVKRFAAAIVETSRWANTHHAESAKVLERYTKQQVGPTIRRARFGERLDAALVQPLIDASAKYKVLKATFSAAELIAS